MGGAFSEMMKPQSTAEELSDFTRDLTELARQGKLEPVIGREKKSLAWFKYLAVRLKIILS